MRGLIVLCTIGLTVSSFGADVQVYYPRDFWFDSTVRVALDGLLTGSNSSVSTLYSDKTFEHTVGRRDLFTLTYCGQKDVPRGGLDVNQDRAFALQQQQQDDHGTLIKACGVLDGHGNLGHYVAEFARNEIVERLLNFKASENLDPSDPSSVSSYLESLLVAVDGDLPEELARQGGATVSMVVQIGSYIYLVNAGDSQSFLISLTGTTGKVTKLLSATRLDKPDLPEEKERLERMGGQVTQSNEQDEARVWFNITDPTGRSYPAGLAMSRGIGDRHCIGVIPNPIVQVFAVDELLKQARSCEEGVLNSWGEMIACDKDQPVKLLAVSATDGLIDYVNGTMAADMLFRRDTHVFTNAQHMFYIATHGWTQDMKGKYRDDMSLAVFEVQL